MVRSGSLEPLRVKHENANTFDNVYREMFIHVVRDYAGLPDAKALKAREIRFFYSGLEGELKHHTKPGG